MAGQAVWLLDDIVGQPLSKRFLGLANAGSKNGNLALDPHVPDRAVVMARRGGWQGYSADGPTGEHGTMNIGNTGEKFRFLIRPRDGQPGVWHVVMSGYSEQSSSYLNSEMGGERVVWADAAAYPEMGGDLLHPGLGLDGKRPNAAYFAIRYHTGLVLNVWTRDRLVYDPADLPVVDADAEDSGNGTERSPPQWVPVSTGGAIVCWTGFAPDRSRRIRLLHVLPNGRYGEVQDVAAGGNCALAADREGSFQLVYVRDGLYHRRLRVAEP